jgi:hypothetical protein
MFQVSGNQMENDRYWQNITFYILENVRKFTFFQIFIKSFQKVLQYYDPTVFFHEKYHHGFQKTQKCMLISYLIRLTKKNFL